MARLLYAAITSLDGYVADESGGFDWAAPDDEVHEFVNDLERTVETHLYGRRMYEVMRFWAEGRETNGWTPAMHRYAEIWRGADNVVYSTTMTAVSTARTRIEPRFDPAVIRRLKDRPGGDLSVAGPHLAGQALHAGLVDELHLFVTPVVVGGGTRALPDGLQQELELAGEHRFGSGVVHLHYRLMPPDLGGGLPSRGV